MKKHMFVAGAAVLALGFTASIASAVCSIEHPKKASGGKMSFVQAMVSCGNVGGNTPNSTTEGGVPSCTPPQTYHEQAGSPNGGWMWDEGKGSGSVQFKAAKNKVVNVLNDVPNSADLAIQLSLAGVIDETGPAGPAFGTLATVARATLEDRTGSGVCSKGKQCNGGGNDGAVCSEDSECPSGTCSTGHTCTGDLACIGGTNDGALCTADSDCTGGGTCTSDQCPGGVCEDIGTPMTVVDFPAGFQITVVDGKSKLKTSANVLLNGIGQQGLPGCSSIELISVTVVDPNGNTFANLGTFLPNVE
jgi:hypothetical protein